MNFISNLRAKAAVYMMPDGYSFHNGAFERIWGAPENASGEAVTPESSLRTVAVMRCVSIIAGVAASFPIDVIRRVGGRREHLQNHLVERRLDWNPNAEMSAYDFRFASWAHFLLWGNSYALKVVSGGRLVALWPLHPAHVEIRRAPGSGELEYIYTGGAERKPYAASEILHVRNFTLDGIKGLSVIQQAALAVGVNKVAEKTAATILRKGTRPTIVMEIPKEANAETKAAIRKAWAESNGGNDNAGALAIAENGTTLKTLSIPATDIEFLAQRQHSDEQMAMMFGVPPSMLGITTKTTSWGTGIATLKQGFLDFTMGTSLKNHEQAYERSLLTEAERDVSIKHNTAAFLRMDHLQTIQALGLGIQRRIYNPNEARSYLDLDPYDGGEEYFAQMQDLPIDAALMNKPGGTDGQTTKLED